MLHDEWILDEKISSLIRKKASVLARTSVFVGKDPDDIKQDLTVHLLQKAKLFDPTRSQPATFAARLIRNRVKSMVRAARVQKRDARSDVSLDAPIACVSDGPISPAECIDESMGRRHTGQRLPTDTELVQLKLDVEEANKNLCPKLREMAALLSHVKPFAAAQVMGISRQRATQHVEALRECYAARGLAG